MRRYIMISTCESGELPKLDVVVHPAGEAKIFSSSKQLPLSSTKLFIQPIPRYFKCDSRKV